MRHFLIFQKFTFLRLYMGLPCIHNIRTSKALDGSIKKLQCAKNERLRLFYCLTPLQQKMPVFLNFKPKLFSKKGRFWENVLDSFWQFLPLKSLYF